MDAQYGLPRLDTQPLPLWMTEPTQLHVPPFQPFYLSLDPSNDPSPASTSSSSSSSNAQARTSALRGHPSLTLTGEDPLSAAFWKTVHTSEAASRAAEEQRTRARGALRAAWGAVWDTHEAQVTWDTQDSRRGLLWFETEPGSGVYYSRERAVVKKNMTRGEKRREEAERAREREKERLEVGAGPSPRKRARPAPVEPEAGPSRRSARNKSPAPSQPRSRQQSRSRSRSRSAPLAPDSSPATQQPSLPGTPASALSSLPATPVRLSAALPGSPGAHSSSGSSTACSPPAEPAWGRERSGSTASAGTVVAPEAEAEGKSKRKRVEDEEGEESRSQEEGEGAVRRTTRARSRTSKAREAQDQARDVGVVAAPERRRRAGRRS